MDTAVTQPTKRDTVVSVEPEGCVLGEMYDVMRMYGLAPLRLATAQLTGETVPASYCV
jgi:hypothetical protein